MPFDRAHLDELTGGDEETTREIANLFVSDSKNLLVQMAEAMDAGEETVVRRIGHTLKSSSASMGALEVSAIARDIEEGGIPTATDRIEELRLELHGVFVAMGDLVDPALITS